MCISRHLSKSCSSGVYAVALYGHGLRSLMPLRFYVGGLGYLQDVRLVRRAPKWHRQKLRQDIRVRGPSAVRMLRAGSAVPMTVQLLHDRLRRRCGRRNYIYAGRTEGSPREGKRTRACVCVCVCVNAVCCQRTAARLLGLDACKRLKPTARRTLGWLTSGSRSGSDCGPARHCRPLARSAAARSALPTRPPA